MRIRIKSFGTQLVNKLGPERSRNIGRLRRINVLVELQGPEQDFGVVAREGRDSIPIECAFAGEDDMSNIGAVKALTASDNLETNNSSAARVRLGTSSTVAGVERSIQESVTVIAPLLMPVMKSTK